MKGKLVSFLAGAVAAITIVALPVSALASDGALTLEPRTFLHSGQ